MLRIAVPNKGALAETAAQMLGEAGYRLRRDPKELTVSDPRNDAEFFYLRPRDIATYVGSGALDVGITGRDLLLDSGSAAVEVAPLDFASSTFRFAGPAGRFSSLEDLRGLRVATSYTGLVGAFLEQRGGRGHPRPPRRRRGDGGPARRRGRGRRRRRDRHHPPRAGPRDLRPGHPASRPRC